MEQHNTEHILDSLDGLQKAGPGPFFYTRVQARLQKEQTGFWGRLALYVGSPRVAFATLGIIFLLNAAAFFYERGNTPAVADQTEQTINEEYNTTLAANSYYDENNDPR